ncbi:MAG: glycine cleavage system aminomethyltransferase GcvT [Acidimicrobiales bacterium]|jgi:aminomethyltransferase|nr:glycine cleavage system aminomethyltransferase GcvT [Acidimicrobiales bacterium]
MSEPSETQTTKQSPLHSLHCDRGAKFAPFAGFELPLSFEGIISEHSATRSSAGLFDVSHMGIVDLVPKPGISLPTVIDSLELVTPASIQDLEVSHLRYALLTNNQGGVIDDLIVTRSDTQLRLVLNASRVESDLLCIQTALSDFANIDIREDLAQVALQGPKAATVLSGFDSRITDLTFMTSGQFSLDGVDCVISRSGYTGEDGFELIVPAEDALKLAETLLLDEAVSPCGLGARDSLRLEAGLCLYGHELDETITPVEARLGWTIPRRRRDEPTFAGSEVILAQFSGGTHRTRVGISSLTKRPIREGATLRTDEGLEVGVVTSGGFGPTCDRPVAMGYVDPIISDSKSTLLAEVRGKEVPCQISTLPFVPHNYSRN